MNKFMLLLAVVMFLLTSCLLADIAAVGQAPIVMYWIVGVVGYVVSVITAFVSNIAK